MAASSARFAPHRAVDSDEEDGRSIASAFYQHPVQSSSSSRGEDIPSVKTQQVTGSMLPRNLSSVDLLPSPDKSNSGSLCTEYFDNHPPKPGSLAGVDTFEPHTETTPPDLSDNVEDDVTYRDGGATNDDGKPNEETPLIASKQPTKCTSKKKFWRLWVLYALLSSLTILVSTSAMVAYYMRPLSNSKTTVTVRNVNDTIIAAQVNSKDSSKVSLRLVRESVQSIHVVDLYSIGCGGLISHAQTEHSAGNFTLNGATQILFPTYFVEGSKIEIKGYILRASTMTVEIELYIFNGLKHVQDFAANLDKRVYEATIYIKGGGPQNTSTPVNYTVPSTDYYFIVLCATAPIRAEFDMTLHKQVYNTSDHSLSCVIEDSTRCSLSYDFHDKQECILAHVAYVPDLQWIPTYIEVTVHPRRDDLTTTALIVAAGLCVLILFALAFCGFCLYRHCLRKQTRYKVSTHNNPLTEPVNM